MNHKPDLRGRLMYNAKMVGISVACCALLIGIVYVLVLLGVVGVHVEPDH